jgi:hypothetical protein
MSGPPSDASLRILLAFYEENARQARYHGTRRQSVASLVGLATALLLAASLLANPMRIYALLAGGFIIALSLYGFMASLHHHERSRLHVERLHAVREAMWAEYPGGVGDLYGAANQKHRDRFPVFSEKTARIHYAWQLVHVAGFGTGLSLMIAALAGG